MASFFILGLEIIFLFLVEIKRHTEIANEMEKEKCMYQKFGEIMISIDLSVCMYVY